MRIATVRETERSALTLKTLRDTMHQNLIFSSLGKKPRGTPHDRNVTTHRRRHRRTFLELLEPRTLMTTLYWLPTVSSDWNTTDANWNTASDGSGDYVAWDNTTGDDAVFENASPLTITISSSVTANSMSFGSSDITLTGGELTLTGSPQIYTGTANVTIECAVAGSSGLSIFGQGATVTLTGANTYTGATEISGVGQIEFVGNALDALPNTDLTLGSYGQGSLTISGELIWNENDISAGGDTLLTISGDVTLSGGSWNFSADTSAINITDTGTLTVDGGNLLVHMLDNSGILEVKAGSLDITNFAYNSANGSIIWTGGDVHFTTATISNDGTILLDGGSDQLSGYAIENNGGSVTWNTGNLTLASIVNGSGTILLDAPTSSLHGATLSNALYDCGGTIDFTAGTGTNIRFSNNDENSGVITVGEDAEVTLVAYNPVTGWLTNRGILHFTGYDLSSLNTINNAGGSITVPFSVGSYTSSSSLAIGGQSFTPSIAGADGQGSLGSATSSHLESISIGYAAADTTNRSAQCWVYSVMLTDQSQVGQAENLVAASVSFLDGSAFGSGSCSRTYAFSDATLNVNQTYYVYFQCDQYLRCQNPAPYSGGSAWDADFTAVPYDIQFQVKMTTI
jgi:hypothetical protein